MAVDQRIQDVFGWHPVVPYDQTELLHILTLMDKVPIFHEKLADLAIRVEEFAKTAAPFTLSGHYEIEKMIFYAFFAGLENREFQGFSDDEIHRQMSRVKADITLGGIIKSRNIGCEICGENRSVDRCHIVPNKLGGSAEPNNILVLCPTHHRLFDRFMLARGEYASIDWSSKSEPSQHYAENITLQAHMKSWENITSGEFSRVSQFDREFIPFVKYTLLQILGLFSEKKILKRSSVHLVLDPNLHVLAKKVIDILIKQGVLNRQMPRSDEYVLPEQLSDEAIDKMAFEIWQKSF